MTSPHIIERNRAYLNRCIRNAREDADRARDSLRSAQLARDEFELRQRPTYPTTELRLGLEAALLDVVDAHDPGSNQGRQLGGGVSVHGRWGYIWVNAQAPYGEASNGRLWNFTDGEVQEMIEHIERHGGNVTQQWQHESGHTFVVRVAK